MKILHVIANLARESGGPPQACLDAAKLMARRGHQVTIVTTDRGLPAELRARGPNPAIGGITIEAFPGDRPRFWYTSWALKARLETAIPEADVVHLHQLYFFHDWATGTLCRRFAKPYIVWPHGTLDPYIHRRHRLRKLLMEVLFQNAVQRRAAGLHLNSEEEWQLAKPFAHNPRGWVAPNGVDLDGFDDLPPRAALRARYPQLGDSRVVLFFGRLNFKKGVDTTIAAFAAVARRHPDLFLILAGPDDGLRAQAEQWVREAGIADRVLFTGMVTGEDKRMVLAGSDVFVLPSLSENFGIAVVEAAACGLPVIISDRVNIWHDFADAEAGLVAPPEVEPFARHLAFVFERPDEAARMAARGAELVRRRFTWDGLAPCYEAMYREAIGRKGAG